MPQLLLDFPLFSVLLDGQNNDKLLNSSGKMERHTDCPLADIWFKILDCHPKFTDDFFMIGGTSIKSILLEFLLMIFLHT